MLVLRPRGLHKELPAEGATRDGVGIALKAGHRGLSWLKALEMQGPQPGSRTNLEALKTHLQNVLGAEAHKEYWSILRSYFGLKLTRAELDALVPKTIGRENVKLHNHLIRAIYTNAVCKQFPPLPAEGLQALKRAKSKQAELLSKGPARDVEAQQSRPVQEEANGVAASDARRSSSQLAGSGRKQELSKRKRKELQELLAENGRLGSESERHASPDGVANPAEEVPRSLFKRQKQDGTLSGAKHAAGVGLPAGAASTAAVPGRLARVSSASVQEPVAEDLKDEVISLTLPVQAPLGLPFCSASLGGALRPPRLQLFQLPLEYTLLGQPVGGVDTSDLPDLQALGRRMERLAVVEGGLRGVSAEAVKLMNHAVEHYVKSIVASCIQLVKGRRKKERRREGMQEVGTVQLPNGPGRQLGSTSAQVKECQNDPITPRDLMATLELNPHLLGDEMAVALERVALML